MKSIIIKKWIEPYKLLESIKEDYEYQDFTFDTITKNIEKKKFFKAFEIQKYSLGLYMKNVNKYYLFTKDVDFDIWQKLVEIFEFSNEDFEVSDDINKAFSMVDIGKAEAVILIP